MTDDPLKAWWLSSGIGYNPAAISVLLGVLMFIADIAVLQQRGSENIKAVALGSVQGIALAGGVCESA